MLRRETLQGLVDYLAAANDTDSLSAASLPPAQEHISAPLHPPPLPPTVSTSAFSPLCRGPPPADYTGEYHGIPCPKTRSGPAKVGTPVILPATFGGSPRALHQSYLDAMALVARWPP